MRLSVRASVCALLGVRLQVKLIARREKTKKLMSYEHTDAEKLFAMVE